MRKSIISFTIFLIVLFFQPALNARHPEFGKGEKVKKTRQAFFMAENNLYDARLILRIKDKIGITKEQEEKIENLMLDHEAFTIRNSAEIKIKELQFVSYLKSKEMDRKQVEQYIRVISKEKTDLIIHYMNYLLDLRAILTPSQIQKITEIREKMKTLMRRTGNKK